jgi:hypothetical protein
MPEIFSTDLRDSYKVVLAQSGGSNLPKPTVLVSLLGSDPSMRNFMIQRAKPQGANYYNHCRQETQVCWRSDNIIQTSFTRTTDILLLAKPVTSNKLKCKFCRPSFFTTLLYSVEPNHRMNTWPIIRHAMQLISPVITSCPGSFKQPYWFFVSELLSFFILTWRICHRTLVYKSCKWKSFWCHFLLLFAFTLLRLHITGCL